MAQSSSIGSSVEGEKLRLQTRKWYVTLPVRCKRTKKMQYRFKLGMRSEAVIGQAYEDPETMIHIVSSFIEAGDRIEGAVISGWSYKTLKEPNVTKCSGTHSGSVLQVVGGCLAQVDASPREHLDSAEIAARNPEVEQIQHVVKKN